MGDSFDSFLGAAERVGKYCFGDDCEVQTHANYEYR